MFRVYIIGTRGIVWAQAVNKESIRSLFQTEPSGWIRSYPGSSTSTYLLKPKASLLFQPDPPWFTEKCLEIGFNS